MSMLVHKTVRVHGLVSRPDLNDTTALAKSYDKTKDRVAVELPSGEVLALRSKNLTDVEGEKRRASLAASARAWFDKLVSSHLYEDTSGSVSAPIIEAIAAAEPADGPVAARRLLGVVHARVPAGTPCTCAWEGWLRVGGFVPRGTELGYVGSGGRLE